MFGLLAFLMTVGVIQSVVGPPAPTQAPSYFEHPQYPPQPVYDQPPPPVYDQPPPPQSPVYEPPPQQAPPVGYDPSQGAPPPPYAGGPPPPSGYPPQYTSTGYGQPGYGPGMGGGMGGGMDPMMMMMLQQGGGGGGMMKHLMMQQMMGGQMNPLMMSMMMSGGSGSHGQSTGSNMMPKLLMMGMDPMMAMMYSNLLGGDEDEDEVDDDEPEPSPEPNDPNADLNEDGIPDHLQETKNKIDDYLAKQWLLGKRKLTVSVNYGNTPLEYQYLNQYHGIPHPLKGTRVGQMMMGLRGPRAKPIMPSFPSMPSFSMPSFPSMPSYPSMMYNPSSMYPPMYNPAPTLYPNYPGAQPQPPAGYPRPPVYPGYPQPQSPYPAPGQQDPSLAQSSQGTVETGNDGTQ